MDARRVCVSVSAKSPHFARIIECPQVAVDMAMDMINKKGNLVPKLGDPKMIAEERWDRLTHIVFDLHHDDYDFEDAHLPDRGNLPVIFVYIRSREFAQVAREGIQVRVNHEIREIHRRWGNESTLPFFIDHTNGRVPHSWGHLVREVPHSSGPRARVHLS